MDEEAQQLDQKARDLSSQLDALDLYDAVGTKAVLADITAFSADFRRVYNLED